MNQQFVLMFDTAEEMEDAVAKIEGKAASKGKGNTTKLPTPTKKELKDALTELREEAGTETLRDLLKTHGARNLATLDEEEWPAIWAEAKNLLNEDDDNDDDDLDDDDLDDDDNDDLDDDDDDFDNADPETIKAACQAYAKKHGREKATAVLKKFGLNSVRGLKGASDEQRAKIYRAVTK